MPKYFYHATLDESLAGIQKKGLRPPEDTSQCHWGGDMGNRCIGKAFLSEDPANAIYYPWIIQKLNTGEVLSENPDYAPPEIMVLRVRANKVPDIKKDKGTRKDYYVERTIPARDIEYLHGEHCWKNLARQSRDTIAGISIGEWREPFESPQDFYSELDHRKEALKNLARLCDRKKNAAR